MTTQTNTGSEVRHQIGANGRFVLRLPSGDVRIVGTDSDQAVVRDRDGIDLSERFEIGMTAGSLELVARQKFGFAIAIGNRHWGNSSAELDVEVPAHAEIVLDSASADIVTKGLLGPKQIRTASGDLAFDQTGGTLALDAVSGDIDIRAIGTIDLHGKVISGDIHVRAPRMSRLDLATTSGDIRVDAELGGRGPFSVRSISGDVLLVSRGDLRVEAQTITGELNSEVAHRRESSPGKKLLTIGRAGGPTFAFKSVSGDLQIVEPREPQVQTMTDFDSTDPAGGTEPTTASPAADPFQAAATATGDRDDARLEVLRALERGEIDVETATQRLAALEEA